MIKDVLNEQADLLWEWRERIMVLLSRPLTQKEDEADGQEYQRTLDDQGEAETYLQAYAALLADRRVALINERTLLAAHDVREKHLRKTKAAFKATHTLDSALEIPDDLDIQPEHEVLHKSLSDKRKDILVNLRGRAIKSVCDKFKDRFRIEWFIFLAGLGRSKHGGSKDPTKYPSRENHHKRSR